MLESWRYNRALAANEKQATAELREVFLDQEHISQLALARLGLAENSSPFAAAHVGNILMRPDLISNLRTPYVTEVLGMPGAGKTTVLERYKRELTTSDHGHEVHYVEEGAQSLKAEYGDLRYTDPFLYSELSGLASFIGIINALPDVNSGMRMVATDRGQIDRRVFRRTLFTLGQVHPGIMADEQQFMLGVENTPIQIGGIIMMMVRPEVSLTRKIQPGPVTNMDFLPVLYEQYWRLHDELCQTTIPYRIYTCIDAEGDQEEIYQRFKFAMDSTLNLHTTFLAALAIAAPQEFTAAQSKSKTRPRHRSRAQKILEQQLGKKVLIVGGDDMNSENDILNRPFLEGLDLRKRPN